jgi:hypothetical protein
VTFPARAPTPIIPDGEMMGEAWALGNAALGATGGLVPNRVSTRLPKQPAYPYLTVQQVSGGPDGEIPLGLFLLQWDCWAARQTRGAWAPDYRDASLLARTLVQQLTDADAERVNYGTAGAPLWGDLHNASVTAGPTRLEDPAARLARYRVDSMIAITI